MKRRIPYLISALLLSGVMAVVLRNVDFSSPKRSLSAVLSDITTAVPAALPPLRPVASSPAEPLSPQTAPTAATPTPVRLKATPLREVRVRAARDGHDYGWVQLPRGTRVELVRDEGETLVVRFDQVTLRIHRIVAEAGMVVPVPRSAERLAGL